MWLNQLMIQPWFERAKLGIFIHWGIYAVNPTGESWPFFLGEISHEDYMAQSKGFGAENYLPDAWADLFKKIGAGYAILTTKHHDGMALWETQTSDLNVVKSTPAGRDLVAPFCEAMRRKDIHVGLYYSHLDWSHPDYATLPKPVAEVAEDAGTQSNQFCFRENNPEKWEKFLKFHRAQLKELCERFHPELLWFDGDWERTSEQWRMNELREQLHQWSPGVILNDRMKGYGDYKTPEQAIPIESPKGPWEFCMTMNDHWGYFESDKNYKSVSELVFYLVESISRGGNLLLDIGPKADGTFPIEQIERLEGLGRWVNKHAEAVFPTTAGLPYGHFSGPSTLSNDRKIIYLFHYGIPNNTVALKGLMTPVKRISVIGSDTDLKSRKLGGAIWANIPGVLWIDAPTDGADSDCTVFKIELESELELYRGASGAIEQN